MVGGSENRPRAIDETDLTVQLERCRIRWAKNNATNCRVENHQMTDLPLPEKWTAYLNTAVEITDPDGKQVTLTGPKATPTWAFDEPCWVITAWNPDGCVVPTAQNDAANRLLESELSKLGSRFVAATGRSLEGAPHHEDGYLVWGIDRNTALTLGRRFQQDAVFEISAETFTLITSDSAHAVTRPRVGE